MHAFNERDKTVIRALIDARNSGVLSLHDFLEQFYFSVTSNRALIIQSQGHYAVFFLVPALFDNLDARNEEIQAFFDLLALLQKLKKQGYLITYRIHADNIHFFQKRFVNPRQQNNIIILNDQGDHSPSPDSIYDRNKSILFKGTYFHGDLFEFILNNTTGMMIVHKKLEEWLNASNEQPEPDIKSPHHETVREVGTGPEPFFSKINFLLTCCTFLLLLVCSCFIYLKTPAYQFSEKDKNDTVKSTIKVVPDSSIKTATFSKAEEVEDSTLWRGVDISKWNGNAASEIDPSDSITFIICKATEGLDEIDPDFDANWQIIKSKNCILGTYHFYHTDDDPVKQAEHFLSTIEAKGKADMVPIVDIEHESLPAEGTPDSPGLQKNLLLFLNAVEKQCNCTPMIYTNGGFANEYLLNRVFNKYPLWLAAYTKTSSPPVPYAWREKGYKIWQKINSYHLNTHVYDFDVFYGKKTDLYK